MGGRGTQSLGNTGSTPCMGFSQAAGMGDSGPRKGRLNPGQPPEEEFSAEGGNSAIGAASVQTVQSPGVGEP